MCGGRDKFWREQVVLSAGGLGGTRLESGVGSRVCEHHGEKEVVMCVGSMGGELGGYSEQ